MPNYDDEALPEIMQAVLSIIDLTVVTKTECKRSAIDFLDKLIAALVERRTYLENFPNQEE